MKEKKLREFLEKPISESVLLDNISSHETLEESHSSALWVLFEEEGIHCAVPAVIIEAIIPSDQFFHLPFVQLNGLVGFCNFRGAPVPIISRSNLEMVESGKKTMLIITYDQHGKRTAHLATRVIKGVKVSETILSNADEAYIRYEGKCYVSIQPKGMQ